MSLYVCSECGGQNIWQDAWVNPNDISDCRTFDSHYCEDCDRQVGTDEVSEDSE